MFSVLAVTAIAATLSVVAVTAATGTLTRTGADQRRERALHLAEAGASRATTALAANPSYSTTTASVPEPVTRDWVLGAAATAPLETAQEGEYAWIVPANAGYVFGVGYVPGRANAQEVRVLQLEVTRSNPLGELSYLSAGTTTINGNVDISVGGSIHANADLGMTGNASITGNATSTGAFSKGPSVSVNGTIGGGFMPYDVPDVIARDHRHRTSTDLCPDGIVRAGTGDIPCTGAVLGSGLLLGWNGWTWTGTEWRIASSTAPTGGFYIYQANVRISGNVALWNSTVVIEGLRVLGDLVNGDFYMTGNTTITPADQGVSVVTERDVVFSGEGTINGLTLAGEQVALSGNVVVNGQIVSASPYTSTGSPVSVSSMVGNVTVKAQVHAPAQDSGYAGFNWKEL